MGRSPPPSMASRRRIGVAHGLGHSPRKPQRDDAVGDVIYRVLVLISGLQDGAGKAQQRALALLVMSRGSSTPTRLSGGRGGG